jgi:hypothetical protein
VPLKDHARTLTRSVKADLWFTVTWDAARGEGTVFGEADAAYEADLVVENLPKVTAPVPGGSVSFEPNVGGTITSDKRRKFPVIGFLRVDPGTGKGTLTLAQGSVPDTRTDAQRTDDEAKGATWPGAPMTFTIRGDPGVSGGLSGAAGAVRYEGGRISGGAGGAEVSADAPASDGSVVIAFPMKAFDPFDADPGRAEKRPGGPWVASYERRAGTTSVVWSAKQTGGETRESPPIPPDLRRQLDELVERLRAPR